LSGVSGNGSNWIVWLISLQAIPIISSFQRVAFRAR
jgi:hypothetical protein